MAGDLTSVLRRYASVLKAVNSFAELILEIHRKIADSGSLDRRITG